MPDERIEAAVTHWAARFTTQGVDMNDFRRVTSPLQTWAEWLPAWVENGDLHAGLAREAEERGRTLTAGQSWVRAALSYHFAKFVWTLDMEQHHATNDKAVAALRAAHRLLDPTAERIEIPLEDFTMVGNLRRPRGAGRAPLVLLLPGLESTKEEFFNWENVFLDRGLATFSLDGPGQGETAYHSVIHPDYEVAVTATLDALAGRDDLDLGRVGAAGVSLGGYYAPRAAAYEKRLKAAVGISGPFNFGDCWEAMPLPTRETTQQATGAASLEEAREQAARLDLAEAAPLIDQPLLVITGRLDRVIPWEQTRKIADAAPNAEWVLWEEGTHVCNNIPYKYRPLTADWLREKLQWPS